MGRAVVTTFAVIILGVDFGYDEGTGDKSGIDYLTTTLLYFLITELKFNKSEDHVIVRWDVDNAILDGRSFWIFPALLIIR